MASLGKKMMVIPNGIDAEHFKPCVDARQPYS